MSTAWGRDIDSLYLGYRLAAEHFETCPRHQRLQGHHLHQ
jgi:hypothetical protein